MTLQSQKGFSLSEALVAVVVFSGVVISTAPMIQSTLKISTRITINAKLEEELRVTNNVMRTRLNQSVHAGKEYDGYLFEGTATAFSFISVNRSQKDPERVSFKISTNPNADTLSVYLEPMASSNENRRSAKLLTSISSGHFIYFGSKNYGDEPEWFDAWSAPSPPRIVALEAMVSSHSNNKKNLRIDATVSGRGALICAYDSVSRSCRAHS